MKAMHRFVMMLTILLAATFAQASECESHYTVSGRSVLRGGGTYSTYADYPSLDAAVALRRLVVLLKEEGLAIQNVDEASGTVTALAKLGGGGDRTAPVEIRTEQAGTATRVHFSIALPLGASGSGATKTFVCRSLDAVRFDPASRYHNELVRFISTNAANEKMVGTVESSSGKRAAKVLGGVIAGALLGAAHAKLTGGDIGKEMAIGAVAGGAVTFAVTKIQDKRLSNRNDVMTAQGYDAAQGYRAGVRSVDVTPKTIKPGEKITIVTTYWAIAPMASESFGVRRYAGIALDDTYLRGFRFSPEPFQFTDGGGEFQTTIELGVPADTPPGAYSLHWVIDGESTGGDDQSTFTVAG